MAVDLLAGKREDPKPGDFFALANADAELVSMHSDTKTQCAPVPETQFTEGQLEQLRDVGVEYVFLRIADCSLARQRRRRAPARAVGCLGGPPERGSGAPGRAEGYGTRSVRQSV